MAYDSYVESLVQKMAWRRSGNKPWTNYLVVKFKPTSTYAIRYNINNDFAAWSHTQLMCCAYEVTPIPTTKITTGWMPAIFNFRLQVRPYDKIW